MRVAEEEEYIIIPGPLANLSESVGSNAPLGLAQAEGSNKVILSHQANIWRLEYVPIDVANGDVYKSVPLSNLNFVLGTNFLHMYKNPSFPSEQ